MCILAPQSFMKRTLIPWLLPVTLVTGSSSALGQMRWSHTYTTPIDIPDAGEIVDLRNVGISGSHITDVSVSLDIVGIGADGGFNGDLYAALSHGSGFSVLLNRVGKLTGTGFGYGDDGIHVTLSDTATPNHGDIHNYRQILTGQHSTPVNGGPAGTWQPDGRLATPDVVLGSTARTATLSALNGLDPGGNWTLLLSDNSAGATSRLTQWNLTITTDSAGTGSQSFLGDVVDFLGLAQILSGQVHLTGLNLFRSLNETRLEGNVDGTGSLVSAGTGELGLYGANSYSGGTQLQAGTLTVGTGSALGTGTLSLEGGTLNASAASPINLQNNFVAQGVTTLRATSAFTLSGAASGSADLHKTGSATLTIASPSSTHTGTWYVDAGTVIVSGNLATSAFRVGNGATLGGTGTVGFTTVESGGTLSPGNSPGQITLGHTVWQGGASYVWQINDATGTAGSTTGWDHAQINGSLSITASSGSPFTFAIASVQPNSPYAPGAAANFNANQPYVWRVASTTQGITGFAADNLLLDTSNFANATQGGSFSLQSDGNNLNLAFAPVPEPATNATLAGTALGVFAWLRRKFRSARRLTS